MAYFSQEYLNFFKELYSNNHKEWFHENKKRYTQFVKEPFYAFVDKMIERVKEHEPQLDLLTKNAVFRINRDIRFSKDKTPYKLHMGAAITPNGRKNMQYPGLYFHLGIEGSMIASGCYMPDKESLYKIRQAIAREPERVNTLNDNPTFKKYFGEVKGERNKVLPKEFKEVAQVQPLIFNKQYYFAANLEDNHTLLRPDLDDFIMEHYTSASDWNQFLKEALDLN